MTEETHEERGADQRDQEREGGEYYEGVIFIQTHPYHILLQQGGKPEGGGRGNGEMVSLLSLGQNTTELVSLPCLYWQTH